MNDKTGPRLKDGRDVQSWESLVRQHQSRVRSHARRLTGNAEDAEDLAQEVFLRAFQKLASVDPVSVEAWLHRVTTNLFIDSIRRRRRRPPDQFMMWFTERLRGDEPTPDEAWDAKSFDEDIATALASLNPAHRAAVVLCDVQGMTYAEIASLLHLKLGTTRSHIHRGRARLRVALGHRSTSDDHDASNETAEAGTAA
jgi:RNA polymerase sigma factor (sigma-70 family)